jgi:cytochrome c553
MNTSLHLKALAAAALLAASLPAAAEPAATPEKVTVCAACHGADGKATQPIYPNLAGQYASYLEQSLREYRAGERKNPVMTPQAAALSDADIRQLAAYYAALPGPLYTPSIHGARK